MDGGAEDKAAISVEAAFKALTEYVARFDPLKLLSQLSLTHLSVPDDKFIGEGHDANRWMVWIEFLAGRLLTHEFPVECETDVTGQTMERIEELLASISQPSRVDLYLKPPTVRFRRPIRSWVPSETMPSGCAVLPTSTSITKWHVAYMGRMTHGSAQLSVLPSMKSLRLLTLLSKSMSSA